MSISITPTGRYALPLSRLQDLIANCATFQALTGTASAAAAKAFIEWGWGESAPTTARAVIRCRDGATTEASSTTGFEEGNMLMLLLQVMVPVAYVSHKDNAYCDLLNKVGAIHAEMLALITAGRDLYPQFRFLNSPIHDLYGETQDGAFVWGEAEYNLEY